MKQANLGGMVDQYALNLFCKKRWCHKNILTNKLDRIVNQFIITLVNSS